MFEAKVRDLSAKGTGIVDHPEGFVCFVSGVWVGEVGEFKLERKEKSYGFASLQKLITPSQERTEAPCKKHGFDENSCGGCSWMFMSYSSQLEAKQAIISSAFTRAGILDKATKLNAIWPSPHELSYRSRAHFKTNGEHLGFVSHSEKSIINITNCPVLSRRTNQTLSRLRERLPEPAWAPPKDASWSFIEIDEASKANEANPNRRIPFSQANRKQNKKMQEWLREKVASLQAPKEAVELFAGQGNFTKILAAFPFEKITAIESKPDTLAALKAQKFANTTATPGDLFDKNKWQPHLAKYKSASVLVLDPPRAGFSLLSQFCEQLPNLEDIFYISCDPTSAARDLKKLFEAHPGMFFLAEVQPLDQFPQTHHIEVLIHAKRIK